MTEHTVGKESTVHTPQSTLDMHIHEDHDTPFHVISFDIFLASIISSLDMHIHEDHDTPFHVISFDIFLASIISYGYNLKIKKIKNLWVNIVQMSLNMNTYLQLY